MRNKFLGTGAQGYHPLRKLQTVYAGLRYAVLVAGVGHSLKDRFVARSPTVRLWP